MSQQTRYIIKQINNVNLENRYSIAKILLFRDCDLQQTNNGTYIDIHNLDDETINEIYDFLKTINDNLIKTKLNNFIWYNGVYLPSYNI